VQYVWFFFQFIENQVSFWDIVMPITKGIRGQRIE
jgi:hypothetical protein